jgi:hypothetical protein
VASSALSMFLLRSSLFSASWTGIDYELAQVPSDLLTNDGKITSRQVYGKKLDLAQELTYTGECLRDSAHSRID